MFTSEFSGLSNNSQYQKSVQLFTRMAFYKGAIPFTFLGVSDYSMIDHVAWLLSSVDMREINDLLALWLYLVGHIDSQFLHNL